MLIAEDLLLLLTDDDTGRPLAKSPALPFGLAGALLIELAMTRRADVAGPGEPVKEGRIVVRDATPTGDQILAEALVGVGQRAGKKPQDVIGRLQKGLQDRLYARLEERGLVRRESNRVLGLFPRISWPGADVPHEQQVRAAIEQALVHDVAAEPRVAALIGLLFATDAVTKVVDPAQVGVSKRDLKCRAQSISEQS